MLRIMDRIGFHVLVMPCVTLFDRSKASVFLIQIGFFYIGLLWFCFLQMSSIHESDYMRRPVIYEIPQTCSFQIQTHPKHSCLESQCVGLHWCGFVPNSSLALMWVSLKWYLWQRVTTSSATVGLYTNLPRHCEHWLMQDCLHAENLSLTVWRL